MFTFLLLSDTGDKLMTICILKHFEKPLLTVNIKQINHINLFCFVLFCLLEKIKGEIENNIEMKSHFLDLRNHFLNRYMPCIIGKTKFSFFKPTLLNFLCLLLSPVHE